MQGDDLLPSHLQEEHRDDDFAVWVWMIPVIAAPNATARETAAPDEALVASYIVSRSADTAREKAAHWIQEDGRFILDPANPPEYLGCWRAGEEPEDEDLPEDDEAPSPLQCIAEAWVAGASFVFQVFDDEEA